MIQAKPGIHFLQPAVLFFQVFEPLYITGFHAAVFALPVVKCGFADTVFAAEFLRGSAGFLLLQYGRAICVSVNLEFFIVCSLKL